MTVVDLFVLALVAAAIVHGIRLGAAVQVASFAGFWGGLALGAELAPQVSRLATGPGGRLALGLITLFAVPAILSTVGRSLAVRLLSQASGRRLLDVDR